MNIGVVELLILSIGAVFCLGTVATAVGLAVALTRRREPRND